jgi:hypothetical protein
MTAASRARAPGTARGRSSVSRVRTLLPRGNRPFRYGRRLPAAAGVTVFSRHQWLAVHETVFDCTFNRGRAAVDARSLSGCCQPSVAGRCLEPDLSYLAAPGQGFEP